MKSFYLFFFINANRWFESKLKPKSLETTEDYPLLDPMVSELKLLGTKTVNFRCMFHET